MTETDVNHYLDAIDERNRNTIAAVTLIKMQLPSQETLDALLASANIGHVKGIHTILAEIEKSDKNHQDFVARMRAFSNQFQIEEMKAFLEEMINER
jgi:hypothetical protein